jgi:hypothetical protein
MRSFVVDAGVDRRRAQRDAVDGDAARAELPAGVGLRLAGAHLGQQIHDQRALPLESAARHRDRRRGGQRLVQDVAADLAQVAAAEQRLGRAQHPRQLGVAVHARVRSSASAFCASRSRPATTRTPDLLGGRTVSQRRKRPTSASALFSQNW